MKPIWEYLVRDFFELECRLSEKDYLLPLLELRREGVAQEHVEPHPAFSIDGRLIVILRHPKARQCWFYDPAMKKLIKRFLK